jgi:hypothetical protein
LTIVLSVHFSVLFVWPLCCMYIFDLRLLIIPLVSLIYGLWLPFWYLWFTASDYPFGIFDLRLLITPLVSLIYGFWLPLWYLWFTAFDYPFGIFDLRLVITPLVSLIYPFGIFKLSFMTEQSEICIISLLFLFFHWHYFHTIHLIDGIDVEKNILFLWSIISPMLYLPN